jgi:hypothetical protein
MWGIANLESSGLGAQPKVPRTSFEAIRGMEAIAERPDDTRVLVIPYPTPLFEATGRLTVPSTCLAM